MSKVGRNRQSRRLARRNAAPLAAPVVLSAPVAFAGWAGLTFAAFLAVRYAYRHLLPIAESEYAALRPKQEAHLREMKAAAAAWRPDRVLHEYASTAYGTSKHMLGSAIKVGGGVYGVDEDDELADEQGRQLVTAFARGGSPNAIANGATQLQLDLVELLSAMLALQWRYWAAHWQAEGPSFYGDHELLERLYKGGDGGPDIIDQIDALGEKIVNFFGAQAVNPAELARRSLQYQTPGVSTIESCRALENVVQTLANKAWQTNSAALRDTGIDDMLMSLVNERQTASYLLNRRLGGSSSARANGRVRRNGGYIGETEKASAKLKSAWEKTPLYRAWAYVDEKTKGEQEKAKRRALRAKEKLVDPAVAFAQREAQVLRGSVKEGLRAAEAALNPAARADDGFAWVAVRPHVSGDEITFLVIDKRAMHAFIRDEKAKSTFTREEKSVRNSILFHAGRAALVGGVVVYPAKQGRVSGYLVECGAAAPGYGPLVYTVAAMRMKAPIWSGGFTSEKSKKFWSRQKDGLIRHMSDSEFTSRFGESMQAMYERGLTIDPNVLRGAAEQLVQICSLAVAHDRLGLELQLPYASFRSFA
jgi:DNA-binding ferritin-like protein